MGATSNSGREIFRLVNSEFCQVSVVWWFSRLPIFPTTAILNRWLRLPTGRAAAWRCITTRSGGLPRNVSLVIATRRRAPFSKNPAGARGARRLLAGPTASCLRPASHLAVTWTVTRTRRAMSRRLGLDIGSDAQCQPGYRAAMAIVVSESVTVLWKRGAPYRTRYGAHRG